MNNSILRETYTDTCQLCDSSDTFIENFKSLCGNWNHRICEKCYKDLTYSTSSGSSSSMPIVPCPFCG